jgi:hypothetical protein
MKSETKIMSSDQKRAANINQRGRNLLTLIRAAGSEGIDSKGLTDALRAQLSKEDYDQLNLLEAEGSIIVQQVTVDDHPDVDRLYRAVKNES